MTEFQRNQLRRLAGNANLFLVFENIKDVQILDSQGKLLWNCHSYEEAYGYMQGWIDSKA